MPPERTAGTVSAPLRTSGHTMSMGKQHGAHKEKCWMRDGAWQWQREVSGRRERKRGRTTQGEEMATPLTKGTSARPRRASSGPATRKLARRRDARSGDGLALARPAAARERELPVRSQLTPSSPSCAQREVWGRWTRGQYSNRDPDRGGVSTRPGWSCRRQGRGPAVGRRRGDIRRWRVVYIEEFNAVRTR